MSQRINLSTALSAHLNKLVDLSQLKGTTLDETLLGLVHHRASQINGCAFCLDMDVKEAKLRGERELRLHHVAVWRESTLFSARERAALEWTETLTRLPEGGVGDEIYGRVRELFSEKELAELTLAIGVINVFNRLNVAFRTVPGTMDQMFGLDKAGLR